jgi:hypothetical protein
VVVGGGVVYLEVELGRPAEGLGCVSMGFETVNVWEECDARR